MFSDNDLNVQDNSSTKKIRKTSQMVDFMKKKQKSYKEDEACKWFKYLEITNS